MSDAAIRLLQEVERSREKPIDGNTCREVIAENIRLREALEDVRHAKMPGEARRIAVVALAAGKHR